MGRAPRTFIIAEAGINHNGSLKLAKKLVDISIKAGADAVKFQTFKADNVISVFANKLNYQKNNNKDKQSQLEMLKSVELSDLDHVELHKYCKRKKIIFMSTPKDIDSARFLNKIGTSIFKIGSGEAINYELIREISTYKKKVIISTGMCTLEEVNKIYNIFKKNKRQLSLLHCTTLYPCPVADCNLLSIKYLQKKLPVEIGFSDHTIGIDASIAAVCLGAKIIEKHITTNNKLSGPDHKTSLNYTDFKKMVMKIRIMEKMLGDEKKEPSFKEKKNIKLIRRGLVFKKNFEKGKILTKNDIMIKRPMIGLMPEQINIVVGKKLRKPVQKDEPIQLNHLQ